MNWDKMKAAVQRGAERELKLSMKPGSDIQICGPFKDVRVEGLYLGWTSYAKADELQALYDKTPSRLRHGPEPKPVDLGGICTEVGLALQKVRQIEANMLVSEPSPADICDIRNRLQGLHERVLLTKQEHDQTPLKV